MTNLAIVNFEIGGMRFPENAERQKKTRSTGCGRDLIYDFPSGRLHHPGKDQLIIRSANLFQCKKKYLHFSLLFCTCHFAHR